MLHQYYDKWMIYGYAVQRAADAEERAKLIINSLQ